MKLCNDVPTNKNITSKQAVTNAWINNMTINMVNSLHEMEFLHTRNFIAIIHTKKPKNNINLIPQISRLPKSGSFSIERIVYPSPIFLAKNNSNTITKAITINAIKKQAFQLKIFFRTVAALVIVITSIFNQFVNVFGLSRIALVKVS